jgi:hypothetical protein
MDPERRSGMERKAGKRTVRLDEAGLRRLVRSILLEGGPVMSKRQYLREVETIAKRAFDEAVYDGATDWNSVSDHVYGGVTELIKAYPVSRDPSILPLSENPDAYLDELGEATRALPATRAFWAVRQDVLDAFNDLVDGWLVKAGL